MDNALADWSIVPVSVPFENFHEFKADAESENYEFVDVLIGDWQDGSEDFSEPGARFLGLALDGKIVGVGGLGHDQHFPDQQIGRIKHVYVLKDYRRRGIARLLALALMQDAEKSFGTIRLHAASANAARLYEELGFEPIDHPTATHIKQLIR